MKWESMGRRIQRRGSRKHEIGEKNFQVDDFLCQKHILQNVVVEGFRLHINRFPLQSHVSGLELLQGETNTK